MLKRYGSIDFSQDVMNIMNEYGNNEDDYDINLGKKKGETNLIGITIQIYEDIGTKSLEYSAHFFKTYI